MLIKHNKLQIFYFIKVKFIDDIKKRNIKFL